MNTKASLVGLASALLLAATPLVGRAQAGGSMANPTPQPGSQGSMDQGTMDQGTMDQGAMQQQGAAARGSQRGTSRTGTTAARTAQSDVPTRVDSRINVPTMNNCRYTARVQGNIDKVAGRGAQGGESLLQPNLTVTAMLSCPNVADIRVSDNVTSTSPLTRTQLERMISMHAAVASNIAGPQCLYMPNMAFRNGQLQSSDVAYLCATPTGTTRGGGPARDQNAPQNAPDSTGGNMGNPSGMQH